MKEASTKNYFVKLKEDSKEFYILIKKRPTAFALLALIALRSRKEKIEIDDGIEVGEAFIGDYKTYGVSERMYRTDKEILKNLGISTFRSTSKGTIAKIVNTSIIDISRKKETNKLTGNRQATDGQPTTKQEGKKERSIDIYISELELQEIANKYEIPLVKVKSKYEDMIDWMEEVPIRKKGRNYKATLMGWLRKDKIEKKPTIKIFEG